MWVDPSLPSLSAHTRALHSRTHQTVITMAALTISAPIVARAGSFAGRKLATNATNGTVGKVSARAVWIASPQPGFPAHPALPGPHRHRHLAPAVRADEALRDVA